MLKLGFRSLESAVSGRYFNFWCSRKLNCTNEENKNQVIPLSHHLYRGILWAYAYTCVPNLCMSCALVSLQIIEERLISNETEIVICMVL